jgi:non-heme chloroperoxidase
MEGDGIMSTLDVETDGLGRPVQIYYEDIGSGFPVVLVPGWPLDHAMWENQAAILLDNGCRVVTFDRRGCGRSSRTQGAYNYTHFADDLAALLKALDLRDVTLVGYSMGVGDVIRYMVRHLGQRVGRLALVSGVAPSLPRSQINGDGLDETILNNMDADIRNDRYAFARWFTNLLFEGNPETTVSPSAREWVQSRIHDSATEALLAGIRLLQETDFTEELRTIVDVPALIVHGESDRFAPIAATGVRVAKMFSNCVFKVYDDAPHGLFLTHAQELGDDILGLVKNPPNVTLPLETA